jgi:hypothetical protein
MNQFNMSQFLKWAQKAQENGTEGGDNKANLDRHQSEKRETLEDAIRKNAEDKNNQDNS